MTNRPDPRPALTAADDLILRDVLAIDRTILANERTLLAYLRTTLAFLAAGGSLIHFVETWWALPIGLGLIAAGALLFGVGVWRYRRVHRHLRRGRHE
jgi:putative membrane protein